MTDAIPRILIVDPDPEALDRAARLLVPAARLILEASPQSAGEQLGEGSVDVVLVDHLPPRINGLDLGCALRDRRPSLALILTSERLDDALRSSALLAGFDDFLAKPLDPVDARFKIARALALSRVRRRGPSPATKRVLLLELSAISLELEARSKDLRKHLEWHRRSARAPTVARVAEHAGHAAESLRATCSTLSRGYALRIAALSKGRVIAPQRAWRRASPEPAPLSAEPLAAEPVAT